MTYQTLRGALEFIPAEAHIFSQFISDAKSAFESMGFDRIKTPTIEHFEPLRIGLGAGLESRVLRFFDPNGQILCLRPDHTAAIARLVSTRMRTDSLPLNLYYLDPVFRHPKGAEKEALELYQAGVEFIGATGIHSDLQAISACLQTLSKMGLTTLSVDIGHVSFTEGLDELRRNALLSGDYLTFGCIPERGGPECVSDYPDLVTLYDRLTSDYPRFPIAFNKGLVKDLGYYSGIIFEVFDTTTRQVMASGGRYDGLMKKFGYDQPAVGFAISLNSLQKGRKPS